MAWSDLIALLDASCISVLGGVPATFTPQGGSAQVINGLIQSPAMAEDYIPGGTQGVAVVRFFVRFSTISPAPHRGDAVTINGTNYVIQEVDVDVAGSGALKLRAL